MVEYNTRHYTDMGRELVESSFFGIPKKSGIDIPLFEKAKKTEKASQSPLCFDTQCQN